MAERGIIVDHSTLHRRVIRLVPLLDKAFRLHKRAVDTADQTVDFLLRAKRDAAAAWRFFRKAIHHHGEPEVVTIDKSFANTVALTTLNANKPEEERITIRQSKYLNNLVEQDHRNIKRRSRAMLGSKSFWRAQTILTGIKLIHMIRKGNIRIRQVRAYHPLTHFICCVALCFHTAYCLLLFFFLSIFFIFS